MVWNSEICRAPGRAGVKRAARRRAATRREEAARGTPRQRDLLERCEVRRDIAAKVVVDERELGCEHGASVELDLLLEDEPLEHEARGDVAITDRPGERVDGDRADLPSRKRAAGRRLAGSAARR